ncbi:hypothetical protein LEP1GSC058_1663 [Leptospira fainei serovar Hurstbridge str. BUT 6]|uniref:Cytochrome C n=1 Tax=Leptospira fainei serovar Hurstbridge str. BUT 6 TaxID=1193011 RepID=S3VES1_9LEPT|nr:hypothetical protein [Leptospira fainei]EPG74980.1 hypothetical protein LEP1GSC058_1663 [Leptospira fainei serovar Hurstbridge str. BUT 6]
MNLKKIPFGLIAITLWILTITFLIYSFIRGNTTKSKDGRVSIYLNEDERILVLTEMRGLLTSINGVLGGLSEGDYEKASESARASGMGLVRSLEKEEKKILLKLPIEFKQLGFGTHEQFDVIAEKLKQKKELGIILNELDILTRKCVACHATYRIDLEIPGK